MSDCPVCVFHATNLKPEDLEGHKCWNCGQEWGSHRLVASKIIAPSQAFAVNPNEVWKQDLRTGKESSLADDMDPA